MFNKNKIAFIIMTYKLIDNLNGFYISLFCESIKKRLLLAFIKKCIHVYFHVIVRLSCPMNINGNECLLGKQYNRWL